MMKPFRLDNQPYIALVRRSDVKTTPDDPLQLAIYAPGTVCFYWLDHQQKAASFSYGFLVYGIPHSWNLEGAWGLAGPSCAGDGMNGINLQPWKTALNQLHPLVGTGLDVDWRRGTQRSYWRLVKLIGLMIQVEPQSSIQDMLRSYLHHITRDKAEFSLKQKRTLLTILRKRGANRQDTWNWNQELDAHLSVIETRRDFAFRLARLAALDLDAKDLPTVESLRAFNTSWRDRRMRSLTAKQKKLVSILEAKYLEQRASVSQALAQALVREFKIETPPR